MVKIKIAYPTPSCVFHASTKRPVVLGHEFSGAVTEIGPDVKNIKVGATRVTSETTFKTCGVCPMCKSKDYNLCGNRQGIGTQINGSMAEYLVSREESVHVLPDNVSLLSAALTEPLACGVHAAIAEGQCTAWRYLRGIRCRRDRPDEWPGGSSGRDRWQLLPD